MRRRTILQLGGSVGIGLALSRASVADAAASRLSLKMQAWLPDGTPLSRHALNQLYFLDLQQEPLPNPPRQVKVGCLWSAVPSAMPFAIALRLPVSGFGEVVLYADRQGQGLTPKDFPLNLNLAFAQTRIQRVQVAFRQWQRMGFTFTAEMEDRLEEAIAALRRAEATTTHVAQIYACNTALAASLWLGEQLVFAKAQQTIGRYQSSRTFRFGCNAFGYPQAGPEYERYFRQVFNFATVPFYWKPFEPQQGKPEFAQRDQVVSWLERNGITPKGHPLAWFHEVGVPDWVRNQPYAELKRLLHQRIVEVVAHYGDRIPYYDVINEAHGAPWANLLNYTPEQFLELTQLAATAAHQANPRIVRILNCCCLWGEAVAYYPPPQRSPYQYLKACIAAGIPFEVIGLQLYYPDQDFFEMDRLLERFGQLGKPLHITELGVSSATGIDAQSLLQDARGLWHAPWSETIQADWVEQLYTLCYSKPYIEAISWWDFSDQSCFWPFGGLLDQHMRPKAALYRLRTLLAQWRYQSQ